MFRVFATGPCLDCLGTHLREFGFHRLDSCVRTPNICSITKTFLT